MSNSQGRTGSFSRFTLADMGDNDAILTTISAARIQSFSGDYLDTSNRRVVLQFAEAPGKDYVLNATSYNRLSERYGRGTDNEFADWIGREVVLSVVDTEDLKKNPMRAVWVADVATWKEAKNILGPAPKTAAKKVTRRPGGNKA